MVLIGWNAYRRLFRETVSTSIEGTLPIQEIVLDGPASKPEAEISGMAWFGDWLILLPQYPARFENHVFALSRAEIVDYLDGENNSPLTPLLIPFDGTDVDTLITGFEGFEAIAFSGNQIVLTIEANQGGNTQGFVVNGEVQPGDPPAGFVLDGSSLQALDPQADLSNYSDESLVIYQEMIYTIYEANGSNVNAEPRAHVFNAEMNPAESVAFPNIEYRITDATPATSDGSFWAINYLFLGDLGKLRPSADILSLTPGSPPSGPIERIVAFQITEDGIVMDTTRSPIYLQLLSSGEARNWEAVARLDELGLLIATDKFPGTILALVQIKDP